MRPQSGDLLRIDGRASVQFAGDRALTFRVVSVCDRPTYAGWIWLTGYVINRRNQATAKREVYVQLAGLRRAILQPGPSRSQAPPLRLASEQVALLSPFAEGSMSPTMLDVDDERNKRREFANWLKSGGLPDVTGDPDAA